MIDDDGATGDIIIAEKPDATLEAARIRADSMARAAAEAMVGWRSGKGRQLKRGIVAHP